MNRSTNIKRHIYQSIYSLYGRGLSVFFSISTIFSP